MKNIIEIAGKRDEIMKSQHIYCPVCGQKQFSPFDKLFSSLNDKCIDCSDDANIAKQSEHIFAIIEA